MASLTSVAFQCSSSSLQPYFQSSALVHFSEHMHDHSSWWLRVRSNKSIRQRLYSQMPGGVKILSAATKPAKTPAEDDWKTKREYLLQKRVRSVDVKEALRLQKENNFVILDVRPEADFKEGHPPGAINVQIYRLIKEWTAWDIARRAAFAFFGIFSGTEENPEFIQSVESKIDKNAKIIVACSAGGTMKPSQNLPEGKQSRSLIAAYLLVLNGYTNVFHLEGGLYTWFKEGLPVESEE
ncbi:rhodanese-like domain-containing protein 14, chloroplastic [Quillaja saponaria]|uniref:Rhodanese-like domain-containing protein 14, chloroplastic n=1 Tax=Quillaja saponaria TaxID=32244 RepID=A0AAD7LJN1_QUISA|nr:rhodanese-like domain-containing protein 14, chloroplastic [Quillaja saponaria]KAJ7959392.1 rhodanese-like domain-containing protein 14, chloroplastic [Quillaja saponaria]